MLDIVCKTAKDSKIIVKIGTGIISEKPCKVYAIYISPDYGTSLTSQIFNGTNENVEELLELNASAITSDFMCPSLPLLFDKGIYIKNDDDNGKLMFQLKELY